MSFATSMIRGLTEIKRNMPEASLVKKIAMLYDLYLWKKKYHLLNREYFSFEFYRKDFAERMTYIRDWEIMNIIVKLNSEEACKILNDKYLFNQTFSDLVGRDFLYFSAKEYETFSSFVHKHGRVIVKPLSLNGGKGIYIINMCDMNETELKRTFAELTKDCSCLIEEVLVQHPLMDTLNASSVNTCRVVTMRDNQGQVHIPFANVRIGREGKDVDNFCAGGITAAIDVKNGVISSTAVDQDCGEFVTHPDSGIKLQGYVIPCWNQVIQTVQEAAQRLPDARYIGWDIAIKKDGNIAIIEANHRPEARIHQIPAKRGLRDIYVKYLGDF